MSPGRVLLIDDDPKVLRLLEATLRLKSYDVVKMESGVEALTWLRGEQPDLIISDIMMPDLDGYDFFRRVKASTRSARVPFIFLSARSEPADVVRGLRLGADEFLRKPFSIDELLVRVERVLRRAGDVDESMGGKGVFDGDLAHMPLADVLRMLCVQRKTGLLRLDPKGVKVSGAVQLVEGQVVHAEFGVLSGESALCQLLLHESGRFSFRPGEELPQRTIEVQTLPLLMEAFRLMDIGVLRRIDPHNQVAAATVTRLIQLRRSEVGGLPRIDEIEEPAMPLGMAGLALRLTKGRSPPGSSQEGSIDETDLDDDDFHETVQLDSRDLLVDSLELKAMAEFEPATVVTERYEAPAELPGEATDYSSVGGGPDTWDRAGVLDDTGDPDDSEGLDSVEMAPLIATGEFERLEQEIGLHRGSRRRPPPPVSEVPSVADVELEEFRELEDAPTRTEPLDAAPDGTIMVTAGAPETGIALVDDTHYEVPVIRQEVGTDDIMGLYERLKSITSKKLKSREVMLGTRSGRVIASAIRDDDRRGTLAAFSAQAIAFASEDPTGQQFAVLDAGDLHVIVVEVDHLRLFTILFDRKPEPAAVLAALRPELTRWPRP
jgi:DNA-binding response OmpR family regulator